MAESFQAYLDEHLQVTHLVRERLLPQVEAVSSTICTALAKGGSLYVFGNGGSAADAQHFATELIGRYRKERHPLSAVALTADSSALTCIGNDYDFQTVFARQVEGLARPGDVVVGITASGNSENVIRGLASAKSRGAVSIALTGGIGGRVATTADHAIVIPSGTTARIQEMHILIIHLICERIDEAFQDGETA